MADGEVLFYGGLLEPSFTLGLDSQCLFSTSKYRRAPPLVDYLVLSLAFVTETINYTATQ